MKNLLSIESLIPAEIAAVLETAAVMKSTRGRHAALPLQNQCWALMFSKSSTRTRVSFETGIRELGGQVMFLAADDIQLGRGEPICDTARVMGRMLQGAVIRTFAQKDVEDFAAFSGIPTINALTDEEHPCQILSDLFTIQETGGPLDGQVVTFIGFELRIAAPEGFQPAPELLAAAGGRISVTPDLSAAAEGSTVLYTDVWVSMGKEQESAHRISQLQGYQINAGLCKLAPDALVMHCLPAYRGKEITAETFEAHAGTIFRQAENRLHAQKAVLVWCFGLI